MSLGPYSLVVSFLKKSVSPELCPLLLFPKNRSSALWTGFRFREPKGEGVWAQSPRSARKCRGPAGFSSGAERANPCWARVKGQRTQKYRCVWCTGVPCLYNEEFLGCHHWSQNDQVCSEGGRCWGTVPLGDVLSSRWDLVWKREQVIYRLQRLGYRRWILTFQGVLGSLELTF